MDNLAVIAINRIHKQVIWPFLVLLALWVATNQCLASNQFIRIDLPTAERDQSGIIHSICQDYLGYIWIGQSNGLYRFDGYEYKKIPSVAESQFGIGNNRVRCVFEGSDSVLWIGTRGGGLNRYNRKSDSFTIFTNNPNNPRSLSYNDISWIYEDTEKNLWVGTDGGGLNRFCKETESFEQIIDPKNPAESSTEKILSIFSTSPNQLYIGTWGNGLKKIDLKTGQWEQVFSNLESFPLNSRRNIWSITGLGPDSILLGTFGEGALVFNTKTNQLKKLEGLTGKRIFCGQYAGNGTIYLGTEAGLETVKDGACNLQSREGEIRGIALDRDGHLWVGQQNKLWALKKIPKFFDIPQALYGLNFTTMYYDYHSYLWLACAEKLVRIHVSNYTSTAYPLPANASIAMISGWTTDTLVLATNEGVLFFDKIHQKFVAQKSKSSIFKKFIKGNAFFSAQTPDSTNWVCTLEKLYCRGTGVEKYISKKLLPSFSMSHYVSSIAQKADGSVWIGTYGGGLNHLDPTFNRVRVFKQDFVSKNGLSNNFIESLAFDHANRLWVGSHDGLNLMTDAALGKFKTFTVKDGLPNNEINSLVVDRDGILWVGTGKGLCRIDTKQMKFRVFGIEDGLPSLQFLTHSAYLLTDGSILMGTANGAILFNPSNIPNEKTSPEVIIQSFRIFNEEVHPGKHSVIDQNPLFAKTVRLNYNQNYFGLSFTSFPFFGKENTRYAYQLVGVDKEWQFTKSNSISYTNVPPGRYLLKVKSITGPYISGERIMRIEVVPPWWKSKLAFWIYAALAVLTVIYSISVIVRRERRKGQLKLRKYKIKKEQEMNDLKSAFFSQVSNELKNPLTLLMNPLNELITLSENSEPEIKGHLEVMRSGAFQMKQILDQLVDFKKIGTGEHQSNLSLGNISVLLSRICQKYQACAISGGKIFTFEITPGSVFARFDAGLVTKIQGNVLDFFFNRPAETNEILFKSSVVFTNEQQHLWVTVSDNAGGLNPLQLKLLLEPFSGGDSEPPYGFGLAITNELVNLCKGSISIENFGQGIKAEIRLPLVLNTEEKASGGSLMAEPDKPLLLLVIDHAELRNYISGAFEGSYRTCSCNYAEQALEVTLEKMPNLIICDYELKGMDGLSFYMQLIEDRKTESIPFVLLKGTEDPSVKIEALQAGVYSILEKPFNIGELLAVVRNYFSTRNALQKELTSDHHSIQIKEVQISDNQKELLGRLLGFMEKNYQDPSLSVELLCSELEISRPQLYRKLQTLTGLSVQEFIKSFRLKKAAAFLRSGEQRISDVAYQTGFSDPQHFSKSFKNQFGKSPSQYVAEYRD